MADEVLFVRTGTTNVYTLTKTIDGKTSTITVNDTDGNGLDNNDSVKFSGGVSVFSATEINQALIKVNYAATATKADNKLANIDMVSGKMKPTADKAYRLGSLAETLKTTTPSTATAPQATTAPIVGSQSNFNEITGTRKMNQTKIQKILGQWTLGEISIVEAWKALDGAFEATAPATAPDAPATAPKSESPFAPEDPKSPKSENPAEKPAEKEKKQSATTSTGKTGKAPEIAKALYEAMQGPGKNETALKAAIDQITKDNVVEVMKAWDDAYTGKGNARAGSMGGLIQQINSKFQWSDGKDPHLTHISDSLADRAKAKGFTTPQVRTFTNNIAAQLQAWWTDDTQVVALIDDFRSQIAKKEQELAKQKSA